MMGGLLFTSGILSFITCQQKNTYHLTYEWCDNITLRIYEFHHFNEYWMTRDGLYKLFFPA